jgi:bifunctional ADP-heptose synthase (sugar kinase/adenylyltransferase)
MNRERFEQITGRYDDLRIAVVGDFCLDRYLEIDPARAEVSIETGLTVHNVVRVRSQPGGAGRSSITSWHSALGRSSPLASAATMARALSCVGVSPPSAA